MAARPDVGVLISLVSLRRLGIHRKNTGRRLKRRRDLNHHGRAHAVSALLIFLNLLERDAEGVGKFLLAYLGHHHQATRP